MYPKFYLKVANLSILGIKQSVAENSGKGMNKETTRRSFLKGAAKGAAVAGLAMTGLVDQEAKPASADTPTPTSSPSPAGTPVPDVRDKRITDAHATIEALKKDREAAFLGATQTAIVGEIESIKNPKTSTPTPATTPTASPTFTNEQIGIMRKAGTLPTATSTPTLVPTATEKPEERGGQNKNKGGREFPIKEKEIGVAAGVAAGAVLLGGGVLAVNRSARFKGGVNKLLGFVTRGKIQIP